MAAESRIRYIAKWT